MKILLFTLLCLESITGFAQDKNYEVALSYGAYTSPDFRQNKPRDYFSADFDYHLSRRWTVASGFMTGRFNYNDDSRLPTVFVVGTNAQGFELHGYAMAKYSFIRTEQFTFQLGIGAGLFNQRLRYPVQDASGIYLDDSSFTDLDFPVSVEAYYLFKNRLGIGLRAGGYIEPDFPIVGAHIGPQIRIRL